MKKRERITFLEKFKKKNEEEERKYLPVPPPPTLPTLNIMGCLEISPWLCYQLAC